MSNEPPPRGALRRGLATGRLEALSDGVYAIALTLLVLDIALPSGASRHLLHSVVVNNAGVLTLIYPPVQKFWDDALKGRS